MRKPADQTAPKVLLSLAENTRSPSVPSAWIGGILALGTTLARKANDYGDRQVVVALSVPSREYAAALIGTGWTLGRAPSQIPIDPLTVLQDALPDENYRAVTAKEVISGSFQGLDETQEPPRVTLAGRRWNIGRLEAVAHVAESDQSKSMPRPKLGSIGRMTGIDHDWVRRLVAPATDLALVGTKTWITEDLDAVLARNDDTDGDTLKTLLLPQTEKSATWFTHIYSSSDFADQDQLPPSEDATLTILDGQGAAKYLNDVQTPLVVCVFDRSVADENIAENVVDLANRRGKPVSLSTELRWCPPPGVEAFGFTVAL